LLRPDGRGSPVQIWGNTTACFYGRAAVSQGKHQHFLAQIKQAKANSGKRRQFTLSIEIFFSFLTNNYTLYPKRTIN
jgi:hypothetical protein